MKYVITAFALFFATQALADEPYGMWKTKSNESGDYLLVEVRDCDEDASKLCSEIKQVNNSANEQLIGKLIFWDMEATEENEWRKGKIWDVANNKIYKAKVSLGETAMRVEGCVSIFCDGQDWSRVVE